jgi:hypothetical protein
MLTFGKMAWTEMAVQRTIWIALRMWGGCTLHAPFLAAFLAALVILPPSVRISKLTRLMTVDAAQAEGCSLPSSHQLFVIYNF